MYNNDVGKRFIKLPGVLYIGKSTIYRTFEKKNSLSARYQVRIVGLFYFDSRSLLVSKIPGAKGTLTSATLYFT